MAKVDELISVLGVEVDPSTKSKLQSVEQGLDAVQQKLTVLSTALVGYATAAVAFVSNASSQAVALDRLSKNTGTSVEDLQRWSHAANTVGVNAQAVQSDMEKLHKSFLFAGKDADKSMMQLAKRFQDLGAAQAKMWGDSYGLSSDTVELLRKGPEELAKMKREADELGTVMSPKAVKTLTMFNASLVKAQAVARGLGNTFAIGLAPALTMAVDGISRFVAQNRELIATGLASVAEGIVRGFERFLAMLGKVKKAFQPLIDAISNFSGGIKLTEMFTHLTTGALSGLLMVLAPILIKFALFGALLSGLALVFEDLFSSITTGQGLFADLFGPAITAVKDFLAENQVLAKIIQTVAKYVTIAIGTFVTLITIFAKIKAAIGVVTAAVTVFNAALKANPIMLVASLIIAAIALIITHWDDIYETVKEVWDGITAKVTAAIESVKGVVNSLQEAVTSVLQSITDKVNAGVESVVGIYQSARDTIVSIFNSLVSALPDLGEWALKAKEAIERIIGAAIDWIKEKIAALGLDKVLGAASAIGGVVSGAASAVGEKVGGWADSAKSFFGFGGKEESNALQAPVNTPVNSSQTTTMADQSQHTYIISAPDAQGAATAVAATRGGPPIGSGSAYGTLVG